MNKVFFENNYLILLNVWHNRFKLLFFPFIFAFCFFIFNSIIPEKYEVKLGLLIQDTNELNPHLSDLSISSIQRKTIFYENLIKSDNVLNKTIHQFKNDKNNGDIKNNEFKNRIRNGLKLTQTSYNKNDKNVFNISFKWNNKKEIKKLFLLLNNSFIEAFNESHINSINKSGVFIKKQVKNKKNEILLSEKKIIDFKIKHKNIITELIAFDYEKDDSLDKKITEVEIDLLGIKEKYEVVQNQLIRENPIKKMLELKISKHKTKLSNFNLIYTEKHSLIIKEKQILTELNQELKLMEQQNIVDINQIKKYVSDNNGAIPYLLVNKTNELENLIIEKNKTERELIGLKKIKEKREISFKDFGNLYIELKDLEQDLKIKEKKYNKLLEKEEFIKTTEELKKFEEKDIIQIMNQDGLIIKSLKPPKFIYIIGGYIFGFLLVISISVIQFLLNQNIIKQKEITDILGAPVISRIPNINKK